MGGGGEGKLRADYLKQAGSFCQADFFPGHKFPQLAPQLDTWNSANRASWVVMKVAIN